MKKVVAVTVTYNRINTFTKTLQSLSNQKYELEKIVVVDNNSNQESKDALKKIADKNNKIEIIWKNENLGGAGGFYYGMKYAFEKYNPDYIWIMDDDAYPREECLDRLIKSTEKIKDDNIGFVAPLIYGIDLNKYQLYHHKKMKKLKHEEVPVKSTYEELKEIEEIEADAFVGPLFPKKTIEDIGFPDKDLFIYGDDSEYTYRITRKKKGYLIKDAVIDHQDQIIKDKHIINPKTWWKEYYMYRNRILFINEFAENSLIKFLGRIMITYRVYMQILAVILKNKYKGYRKLRIDLLKKAIYDGNNSIKGVSLKIDEYINSVEKISKRKLK